MNLKQAFKMAVKSIVSKKMRSFLTMLGIIIGVAAVVIMVSALQGQNKKTMEYIESQGTNKLEVSAYSYAGKNVSQELYDYCLGLGDLVQGVTPNGQIYSEVVIKFGSKTISTQNYDDWENMPTIYLGSDQYGLCNNYTIASGREMSHLDIEKENNVCVLGGRVAENLFDFVNPVGQTITLNGSPFTVVGVYERKDVDNWPEMDNIIVLPYTLSRTMNDNQPIENYSVKAVAKNSPKEKKLQIAGGAQGGEARLESNQMPRKPCLARLAAHEVGTFTLRSGGKVTAFSGCEKSLTRLFDSLNGAEPHVDIRRPGPRWSPRWSPQREPPRRGRPGAGA